MAEIKLQIIEGPNVGQELEVEGAAVIGRDPASSAHVLRDPEASRRHASIIPEGQSINVEDLGSTNGTFVNGERIVGARVLVPGDRLRIGTTVLEVALSSGARPRLTAVEDEPAALAGVSGGSPEQPPGQGPSEGGPGGPPPPEGEPPPSPPGGQPPVAEPPPTQAPAGESYPPVAYAARPDYPIDFQVDYPEGGIARWRALFQWVLVIPHAFVLFFVYIGALLALIGAWAVILFTGRYPQGIFDFLAGTARWSNRVTGFEYWMTERYPPFSLGEEPDYPIRTRFDYPPEGNIARWRALIFPVYNIQYLLAIPHFFIVGFLFIAEWIVLFITFFAILFTRKWPRGMFDFTVGIMRWRTRAFGYGYAWMTEKYPPFSLD